MLYLQILVCFGVFRNTFALFGVRWDQLINMWFTKSKHQHCPSSWTRAGFMHHLGRHAVACFLTRGEREHKFLLWAEIRELDKCMRLIAVCLKHGNAWDIYFYPILFQKWWDKSFRFKCAYIRDLHVLFSPALCFLAALVISFAWGSWGLKGNLCRTGSAKDTVLSLLSQETFGKTGRVAGTFSTNSCWMPTGLSITAARLRLSWPITSGEVRCV